MASAHQFKVKAPMHFSGYAQPNELRYAHVVFFLSFYPHIIQFGRIILDVHVPPFPLPLERNGFHVG